MEASSHNQAFRETGIRLITFDRFTPAFIDPALTAEDLQRKFSTFFLLNTLRDGSLKEGLSTESKRYALKSPLFISKHGTDEPLDRKHLEQAQKVMLLEEYRNAQAVSNIKGFPNVHGIGSCEGFPVIVSEYINGVTLSKALDQLPRGNEGGVNPFVAASIVQTAAKILLNAQCLDGTFVHRDLSPRNILIKTDEHPLSEQVKRGIFDLRLVDMGSATYRTPASPFATTKHGIWRFGTAEYAAPEMLTSDIEGIEAKRHSETIDTYALCSILYLLLTGKTPFSLFERMCSSPYLVKAKGEPGRCVVAPESDALLQIAIAGITAQQEHRYSLRFLYRALGAWRAHHAELDPSQETTPPPTT